MASEEVGGLKMSHRKISGIAAAGAAVFAVFGFVWQGGAAPAKLEQSKARLENETFIVMPPVYHRNLALFAVRRADASGTDDYLTLDEGLKSGLVEVREVGANPPPLVRPRPPREPFEGLDQGSARSLPAERLPQQERQTLGGDVNRLMLINRSDRKLLLLAGEMVIGGKQDRIVQKDAIVPPSDKPKVIEVFCVEHGRWSGADSRFTAAALPSAGGGGLGGGIADPTVRGAAQAKNEQQAVWEEVGKKNSQLGTAPQTTYQAARSSSANLAEQRAYLADLEGKMLGKDVVGVIVAVNGKLIWMDLFSSQPLFSKYWPKLLQSYILEAITTRPSKEMEERIRWKQPTVQEAAAYLMDRSGTARFEGEEGVFKLLRIESRHHVLYELSDLDRKSAHRVHTCKMERK
jgi:hypothetical protein